MVRRREDGNVLRRKESGGRLSAIGGGMREDEDGECEAIAFSERKGEASGGAQ
jgi:hypothetical protein